MTHRLLRLWRDHPLPCAVWLATALVFWTMLDLTRELLAMRAAREVALARVAHDLAEAAAFGLARDPRGAILPAPRLGLRCDVARKGPDGSFDIRVRRPDGESFLFRSELLGGEAPRAFARAIVFGREVAGAAACSPAPQRLGRDELPEPEPAATDASDTAAGGSWLASDGAIGARRLLAGTDRTDWALRPDPDGVVRIAPAPRGVWRIDGNLWLDRADAAGPCVVELAAPVTLLVQGNVYLGRSLLVRGRGRLLVTACRSGGAAYRDRDLDGRWSAGDEPAPSQNATRGAIEGSGAIWLGLPGDAAGPGLELECGLYAMGEVYQCAPAVTIGGPLLGAASLTRGPHALSLTVLTERLPRVERERIPGFATGGAPRPGVLVRVQ